MVGESKTSVLPTVSSPAYQDHDLTDLLTLGVIHDQVNYYPDDFHISVKVEVQPYDAAGNALPAFDVVLECEYKPFGVSPYKDRDVYQFQDANSFDFTIEEINDISSGTAVPINELPENAFLDGDIYVNRVFDFDFNTPLNVNHNLEDKDADGVNDEIEITWDFVPGVEYQLEWTFLNNYLVSNPADLEEYDFIHNSTRITTAATSYKIPLIFEKGYLLFRVRAVGRDMADPNQLIFGVWSESNDKGGVDNFISANPDSYYLVTTPHEEAKNWQVTTTFAEEGKKKEVISYYDGSMRNRQSVTRVNTDENIIVGETIYDYQGRPAVNVLPVPVDRPVSGESPIKYFENFNQNASNEPFNREDFDQDNEVANGTPTMSTDEGAAHYYSPDNPNKEAHQAFVPDAEGYAFTQVEYTPDNTGRIRRQSGVGTTFQLGSGHETKYFYGKPMQIQLDRLFGSEVGYAAHYKKNMVVDPNGQISVSYLDQEGRVVATSLAGEPTDNLVAVDSYTGSEEQLVADLFEKDATGVSSINVVNVNGTGVEFYQEILVSTEGDYTLTYDLSADVFTDPCLATDICFNCIYELEIKMTDECGQIVQTTTSDPVHIQGLEGQFTDNSGVISFDLTCTPGTYSKNYTFVAPLTVGNYTISKKLIVSEAAVEFYAEQYADPAVNTCALTFDDFLQEELNNIDYSDCNIGCEECVQSLGDRDDFVAQGFGTAEDYDRLVEECNAPCESPSRCETIYEMLLADMAPGGQYGEFQDASGSISPSGYPLSVYNGLSYLPDAVLSTVTGTTRRLWKEPKSVLNGTTYNYYLDDQDNRAYIVVNFDPATGTSDPALDNYSNPDLFYQDPATGTYYAAPENITFLADFILKFETAWRTGLVTYHPEYCYYQHCVGYAVEDLNGNSSDSFDALLRNTNTFQQAKSTGFVVDPLPTDPNDRVVDVTDASSAIYDPFITSGAFSNSGDLTTRWNTYINIAGDDYSMIETAAIMARCGNTSINATSPLSSDCSDFGADVPGWSPADNQELHDLEWGTLKGLYFSTKAGLQAELEEEAAISSGCYNGCIGGFGPDGPDPAFYGLFSSAALDGTNPCSYFSSGFYADKQRRFAGEGDLPVQSINQGNYQTYIQDGDCPVANGLEQLLDQIADDGSLLSNLIDITNLPATLTLNLALSDYQLSDPIPPATWTGNVSGDDLKYTIGDIPDGNSCTNYIYGTPGFDWTKVVGFSHFQTLNSGMNPYQFTVLVASDDGTGLITYETLTGETCFDVDNCEFEPTCDANDYGLSVEAVLSQIAKDGQLTNTSGYTLNNVIAPSTTNVYEDLFSNQLESALQTNASNSAYIYESGIENFVIRSLVSPDYVEFHINSREPASLNLADIHYFGNIVSEYQHYFAIEAFDNTGSSLGVLHMEASINDGNDVTLTPMGKCELPNPANCDELAHQLLIDLGDYLKQTILAETFDYAAFDPYNSWATTNLLLGELPSGSTASSSQYSGTTAEGETIDGLLIDIEDCSVSLEVHSAEGLFIKEIIAMTPLAVHGTPQGQDYFEFYFLAEFDHSGVNYKDTVWGQSGCIPLRDCEDCPNVLSLGPDEGVSEEDSCGIGGASTFHRIYGTEFNERAHTVRSTSDKGYIVCGEVEDQGKLGPNKNLFAMKLDQFGDVEWTRSIGDAYEDGGRAANIIQAANGEYVLVGYRVLTEKGSDESFIVRLDANGLPIWERIQGGGATELYRDLTEASNEDILVAGVTWTLGQGNSDYHITRYRKDGTLAWNFVYGDVDTNQVFDLTELSDGNIIVTGADRSGVARDNIMMKLDANGNLLWTKKLGVAGKEEGLIGLTQLTDGNLLLSGTMVDKPGSEADFYLVKTDTDANVIWSKTYGGSAFDAGLSAVEKSDGTILVSGFTNSFGSSFDLLVLQVSASGNLLRSTSFGGTGTEQQQGQGDVIALGADGGYIIAGTTNGFGAKNQDLYLVKTNPCGDGFCHHEEVRSNEKNVSLVGSTETYVRANGFEALMSTTPNFGITFTAQELCADTADTSPCASAYNDYHATVNAYNKYVKENQLSWPTVDIIHTFEQFKAEGFCNCVDGYISYLEGLMKPEQKKTLSVGAKKDVKVEEGKETTAPTVADVYIGSHCHSVPCSPEENYNDTITPLAFEYENPCEQQLEDIAYQNAEIAYENYLEDLTTDVANRYREHCLGALEDMTLEFTDKEYHYTLYYYDQAGNLIKTVPPEGVEFVDLSVDGANIVADRTNGTHTVFTNHRLETKYLYNSLNQLVRQCLPDHDKMDVCDLTLPSGLNTQMKISSVQFVTESKGYLTGSYTTSGGQIRGLAYSTNDGGQTWQRINDLVAADMNDVQWITATHAIAVGNSGLAIRSADGGYNWDALNFYAIDVTADLNAVHFSSVSEGIIVGDNLTVVSTTSGTPAVVTPVSTDPNFALDGNDHIIDVEQVGTSYYMAVDYTDASGLNFGLVYRTTDLTATSWEPLHEVSVSDLSNIQLSSVSRGAVAGSNGEIYVTTDAGQNWTPIVKSSTNDIVEAYFQNDNVGVSLQSNASGDTYLYATKDKGANWQVIFDDFSLISLNRYQTDGVSSHLIATGESGAAVRVYVTSTNAVAMDVSVPTSNTLNSGWAVYNGTAIEALVTGAASEFYASNNINIGSPTWITYSAPGMGVITDMEALKSGAKYSGVAVRSTGELRSFHIDGTFSSVPTAGDFTCVERDELNNRMLAYNRTDNSIYSVTVDPTVAPTGAAPFSLVSPSSGLLVSELFTSMSIDEDQIQLTGPTGLMVRGTITSTAIVWEDQTTNIRPTSLVAIEQTAVNDLAATGSNATIVSYDVSGAVAVATKSNVDAVSNYTDLATGFDGTSGAGVAIASSEEGTVDLYSFSGGTASRSEIISVPGTNFTAVSQQLTTDGNSAYVGASNGQTYYVADVLAPTPVAVSMAGSGSKPVNGLAIKKGAAPFVVSVGDNSQVHYGGGSSILKINNVFTPELNKVSFANQSDGFIVGNDFTARVTSNGGETWKELLNVGGFASGLVDLLSVEAVSSTVAYVGGNNSYLGKTDAAGVNTSGITLPPVGNVNDMFFLNALEGVAATGTTGNGEVLHTTDGGANWNSVITAGVTVDHELRAVHGFENSSSYILVGDGQEIVFFDGTNLDKSIFNTDPTPGVDFHDIYFHDDLNGYIVGTEGTLLKSKDGVLNPTTKKLDALTWNVKAIDDNVSGQPTGSDKDIYALSFATRYVGFLGGEYGGVEAYNRLIKDESNLFSTYFWYDKLGRIVVSQNSKQFNESPQRWSYTRYDVLGRVVQAGEKVDDDPANPLFESIFGSVVSGHYNPRVVDDAKLEAWIGGAGSRIEVTQSYYDITNPAIAADLPADFNQNQLNMRKRISAVTYEKVFDGDDGTYDHATHYDYDIHGNVSTLLQDHQELEAIGDPDVSAQRFKKMEYDYDLISGNVHQVNYQAGNIDQWHHRYTYDADNRIQEAYTSNSELATKLLDPADALWDMDCKYIYYDHGPLARSEMGEHNVQGTDYVYTLQGWLKGVNSNTLNDARDPGRDGNATNLGGGTNPNAHFAQDAMGFSLGYYEGDFTPISAIAWDHTTSASNRFEAVATGSDLVAARNDLFNGNIGSMVTAITKPGIYESSSTTLLPEVRPQGTAYTYDQLNRLVDAQAYQNLDPLSNEWSSGGTNNDMYRNTFTYDASGNIKTQLRRDANGDIIDDLDYNYALAGGKLVQNRLYSVNDSAPDPALYEDDIEDMGAFNSNLATINDGSNNYKYDQIGQLQQDAQEEIAEIKWRVDGKVAEIIRESGSTRKNLKFDYDAMANRIAKHQYDNSGNWEKSTYYNRDAQGNVMSVYTHEVDMSTTTASYRQVERNIYGSSRVGMNTEEIELIGASYDPTTTYHNLGDKKFECTNHLGNVLAIISDMKIARDDDSDGTIDYFRPTILSSMDYSPFGVILYERDYTKQVCRDTSYLATITDLDDDFDDGTVQGWSTLPGTTITSTAGELRLHKDSGSEDLLAFKYVTLQSGFTYSFSYDFTDHNFNSNRNLQVQVKDVSTGLTVYDSGLLTVLGVYSGTFVAPSSGNYEITFRGVKDNGSTNGFNNNFFQVDDILITHQELIEETLCDDYNCNYRYGFQGQEKDDEIKGRGNSYNYTFRMHDPRLGRFFAVDPLHKDTPYNSSYLSNGNNPIFMTDYEGKSGVAYLDKETKTVTIKAVMFFYGSAANTEIAAATAAKIQGDWNAGAGKLMVDGVEYDVKFEINGIYTTEKQAMQLAALTKTSKFNFIRLSDGENFDSRRTKSSHYTNSRDKNKKSLGGNSGYFLDYEMGDGKTTATHEFGHGAAWFEANECTDGAHDCSIANGIPGIMSARGVPVADEYGYDSQPLGARTVDPKKRKVLSSDISKLGIDLIELANKHTTDVGRFDNSIFGENGNKIDNPYEDSYENLEALERVGTFLKVFWEITKLNMPEQKNEDNAGTNGTSGN